MENVIGKKLRFYRKQGHYSLEEVSNNLNLSIDEILKFEVGEKVPSIDELIKFSDLYNVKLDDLIESKNDSQSFNIRIEDSKKGRHDKAFDKTKDDKTFISELVLLLSVIVVTIVYLTLGFILPTSNIWNIYWVLYFIPFILSSVTETIIKRDLNKFNITFLVIFIYLIVGLLLNIWHPTWIMFLGIPVYYLVANIIKILTL